MDMFELISLGERCSKCYLELEQAYGEETSCSDCVSESEAERKQIISDNGYTK